MNNNRLMILALSGVPFLMVLGNSMLIPEFPRLKAALNINQFQVGLLITVFSTAAAVSIPFLGFFSDRVGRKKIIIPGLLLYGFGGAVAGVASIFSKNPYSIILISRAIQGVGAAGTAPIAIALVGDYFKLKQRSEAMGILEAANGIGKVLSPVLGTAVALIVWYFLFFSYALLSVPIAVFVWLFVKERSGNIKPQPLNEYIHKIKVIFQHRGVSIIFSFLAGMVILFILFGTLSYISDALERNLRVSGIVKGLILSVPLLFMSTFSYLTGLYLKKKNKYFKLSMALGLGVVAAALVLLSFCSNIYFYSFVLAILGLGSGFVLPALNTLITSAASSEQRGGVTSLYGSIRFTGVALGPPVFTVLSRFGECFMFISGGVLALVSGILSYLFVKEQVLLQK